MQNLTRLIPLPVIGVYINYSFAMLKGAEALFNTVEKYADRIVAEVKEVDKAMQRDHNNPNRIDNLQRYTNSGAAMDDYIYGHKKRKRK